MNGDHLVDWLNEGIVGDLLVSRKQDTLLMTNWLIDNYLFGLLGD